MNDRIKEVMAKAFEAQVSDINVDSSNDSIDTWDSLHHVKLIVFLEREFDIEIPDDVVGNMINYKLIEAVVNECTRSNGSV